MPNFEYYQYWNKQFALKLVALKEVRKGKVDFDLIDLCKE